MARANVTWGEERIAAELKVKLGIYLSRRTVRRYMPQTKRPGDGSSQRWSTFVRNHAGAGIDPKYLQATIDLYPSTSAARDGVSVGGSGFLALISVAAFFLADAVFIHAAFGEIDPDYSDVLDTWKLGRQARPVILKRI
jgi:hypothetical protein